MDKRSAYTLIELVIVILILGILGAVAAPKLLKTSSIARVDTTIQQLLTIEMACTLYFGEHGTLPVDKMPGEVPPEIAAQVREIDFTSTPIGASYDWQGPEANGLPAVGIGIVSKIEEAPLEQYLAIDAKIDDGDLSTGRVFTFDRGSYRFFQLDIQLD